MPVENQKLPSRVEPWLKLVGAIFAVVASLWGALMLFNPIGKLDLTVRIEREIPVSLPADVASLPIRLVFEGNDINRASIVQLEIVNSGSTPIGEVGKKWKLDLRNRDRVTVVPLGEARRTPNNLDLNVLRGPSPDIVTLEIGLFNPGDTIGLELMLVEPKDGASLPIVAETRVPGLSQPVTGRLNVRERLQNGFIPPVFVVTYLLLLGAMLFEQWRLGRWKTLSGSIGYLAGAMVLSLFGSAVLTWIITWGIAWFASTVLLK